MLVVVSFIVFFFKHKTAYEMRISDWSSDVCSSDLASLQSAGHRLRQGTCPCHEAGDQRRSGCGPGDGVSRATAILIGRQHRRAVDRADALCRKRRAVSNDPVLPGRSAEHDNPPAQGRVIARSEESRVGEEGVRKWRQRLWPD